MAKPSQGKADMATEFDHPLQPLVRKLESLTILSDGEREAIQGLPFKRRALNARQDVVRDGDTASQCCLVLDGWACRYKIIREGKRQIFSFHIAGDIPDLQGLHIPLMDHGFATMTTATVAFIPHEAMRDLTARFSGVAAKLWHDMLVDAGIFRQWLICMGRRSAYDQMAHLFCELYLRQEAVGLAADNRCSMPITQVDLADATGLSYVHVNRVLQEMRAKGLITLRGGVLVIEDWDELVRVAEFDGAYLHQRKRAVA
jgi:CRP-like cAMP-binding protein